MSKSIFSIISGITTILGGTGVTIVTALNVPNAAVINAIIMAVAGAIDEICVMFIKNGESK